MSEAAVEQYLVKRVRAAGGVAYKFGSLSHRGVADRIVCLPGQTWFIELKTKGGRLSELQKVFADDMRRLGQNYTVLWSKEEVDEWLLDNIK